MNEIILTAQNLDTFIFNNAYHILVNIITVIVIIAFNAGVNIVILRGKLDKLEFEQYKHEITNALNTVTDKTKTTLDKDMTEAKTLIKESINGHVKQCPLYHMGDMYYTRTEGVKLETDVENYVDKINDMLQMQRAELKNLKNLADAVPQIKTALNDMVIEITRLNANK